MKTIDNRGLNCPEPLLRTKKAFEESIDGIISIVDGDIAMGNIIRFARNNNLNAQWENKDGAYYITLTGNKPRTGDNAYGEKTNVENEPSVDTATAVCTSSRLILITSDEFGRGSRELGQLLMNNLIFTFTKSEEKPGTIIFVNSGVKLCAEGTPVSDELKVLQDGGTKILACGTCLDFYELKDKLVAGEVTNMYDIAELLASSLVVTI